MRLANGRAIERLCAGHIALRRAFDANQCKLPRRTGHPRSPRRAGAERTMSTLPTPQAYFDEAASWDRDREAAARRATRIAWRAAAAACLCATTSGTALVLLMPLKRVEPFVVRVDNSTGIVDVVPVYAGRASEPEVVTRYFLTHYVTVCERFDFATAESDYEECGAFHSAARNQAWYAQWNKTNPASPLNVYKDGSCRACASRVGQLLRARKWAHGSRASSLRQVDPSSRKLNSDDRRILSPRFSMPTRRRPPIHGCAAGIRSASK